MKSRMIFAAVIFTIGISQAMDLQGTISNTLTLNEDSQLVGNVTCMVQGAPCIVLGASNVQFNLNGFTMTG